MSEIKLEADWKSILSDEFTKSYFRELKSFVKYEYQNYTCYPPGKLIFKAFEACPFSKTKVVILGQDPYHGSNQANGLCFSVNDDIALPPSLQNIFKELNEDLGVAIRSNGNLSSWSEQGVLLLNSVLTVRAGAAASHQNKGWEKLSDAAIQVLNSQKERLVFLLWGNYAIKKGQLIDRNRHLVLTSVHPSPLSANRGGWFGQKHFSKTNNYLTEHHIEPIEW